MARIEQLCPATEIPGRIVVRKARPADADAIAALARGLGFGPADREGILQLCELVDSSDNAVFVAEAGRIAVGWAHVFLTRRVGLGRFAEIGGLVVAKEFRRRGAGRLLIGRCKTWAREHQVSALRVRSSAVREEAGDFYQSIGFNRVKTQMVYETSL